MCIYISVYNVDMSFFPVEFTAPSNSCPARSRCMAWKIPRFFLMVKWQLPWGLNDYNPNTMIIMIGVVKYHI